MKIALQWLKMVLLVMKKTMLQFWVDLASGGASSVEGLQSAGLSRLVLTVVLRSCREQTNTQQTHKL